MSKNTFRIQTTTDGTDKQLIVKLDQSYDSLEILSLKIEQDKISKTFNSDYGVLIGRVIANEGLGIPNAKVSVFIALTDEDSLNTDITSLYPFTKITDKGDKGIRYNLITPRDVQAGSFPNKQQFLDNDTYLEVYEKYYKYTTKTNDSGDYMIFGVPVGQQLIHMDVDLGDIGIYSYTADTMVANGLSPTLFNQKDNTYTFKGGSDLEQLPQIISQTLAADIIPLWGDLEDNSLLGITRLDFKINILVNPVAYLTFTIAQDDNNRNSGGYDGNGSHFYDAADSGHIRVGDGDNRPGFLGRLQANPSTIIKAYKYDQDGNEMSYDPTLFKVINRSDLIGKGIYIILLPCDLDKVITNEYGQLVASKSTSIGIGTTGMWRIEVQSNNGERLINWNLQMNGDAKAFKVRSSHIYSVKFQTRDAFTFRDNGRRNLYNSNSERPIFNAGDWVNGVLYFGFGFFDTSGSDRPSWLADGNNYYTIESRVIEVTNYLSALVAKTDSYPITNFVFFSENELAAEALNLKINNTKYGDINSSYEPEIATAFSNRYVFFKGINKDCDCFKEIKNYLSI